MRRVQPAHAERRPQEPDLRALLLGWYREGHRDLPWRRTKDPYAIWVSEIMLQQTRVETVVPYYAKFLARFPTVAALAEAPLGDVLERWSGLGYYRRARLLHAGARAVAKDGLPESAAALRAIPGIGDYTAGAIASIAFGEEAPIVDGNVARVLARVHAIAGDSSRGPLRKKIWALAGAIVRGEDPGALNQALMELGATVCTPRQPSCATCPIRTCCKALAGDRVDTIPAVRKRAKPKPWKRVAIVVENDDGGVLLARRKDHLVFGGLWEPPAIDGSGPRTARALARTLQLLGAPKRAGAVRHLLSHRDLRVDVWTLAGDGTRKPVLPPDYDDHAWVRAVEPKLALSTLAKRILAVTTSM